MRKLLCVLIALAPLALAAGCSDDPGRPMPSSEIDKNARPKGGNDGKKRQMPIFDG